MNLFTKQQKKNSLKTVLFIFLFSFIFTVSSWGAESDYYGTYAGTFSGDDSGYWVASISSVENVFLVYSTTRNEGDGGYLSFYGETGGVGDYYCSSTLMEGTRIDPYIDSSDGSVSGTWYNPSSGDSGSLTGDKVTTSSYEGSYSGTYTGDASGSWTVEISSTGYVTGQLNENSGGSSSFEGGAHPNGYLLGIGTDSNYTDFAFLASVSGTNVTGQWINEDENGGNISGSKTSSGGGNAPIGASQSGGGGGSGCFIESLVQ